MGVRAYQYALARLQGHNHTTPVFASGLPEHMVAHYQGFQAGAQMAALPPAVGILDFHEMTLVGRHTAGPAAIGGSGRRRLRLPLFSCLLVCHGWKALSGLGKIPQALSIAHAPGAGRRKFMSADVMRGRTVLITGANSGIGKAMTAALAGMGAHVIMACRRPDAARAAMEEIRRDQPNASLEFVEIDLAALSSVEHAANAVLGKHPRLDVLINNAGLASMRRQRSADGFELTFAVNHLGPFLLTRMLMPLVEEARGRVINVASHAHRIGRMHFGNLQLDKGYWVMKAYAQSKLANILFTRALASRVRDRGVTVNCFHPGTVSTGIWPEDHWYERLFSRFLRLFMVTPREGARTGVWLAANETGARVTGGYFVKCHEAMPSKAARDDEAAERLWQLSEQYVTQRRPR